MTRCEEILTDENNDENTTKSTQKQGKMYVVVRELFFVFAVAFTAYATLLNSQTKVYKGAPPVPFFGVPILRDFYNGDLAQLMHDITYVEFAVVMFYAPWDADSQDAKEEFIAACEFFGDKIYFAGVNCWEPGSECRNTFREVVYHFPQIVAYLGPQKAIEYKGPLTADHMVRFLHSVMRPIQRINTVPELWNLRYIHDAVLVGHLQFDGVHACFEYQLLYEASLRLASRDHTRQTAVAVFTHQRFNRILGVDENRPSLVLYLWNKKMVYTGPMRINSLVTWVLTHSDNGITELNSNSVLPHVKDGAVMVMFTPRHPLATIIPYYHMLKRIAMHFNVCTNGTGQYSGDDFFSYVLKYGGALQKAYETELLDEEKALREECAGILKLQQQKSCTTVSVPKWDNMTCYDAHNHCTFPNFKLRFSESLRHDQRPEGSWKRLVEIAERERCSLIGRTPPPFIPKSSQNLTRIPTQCGFNTTFSFVALDSSRYSHLANGLGIQLKRLRHQTSVVIFDSEEMLKMKTVEVTETSVAELLRRYLSGERERPLRSTRDTVRVQYNQLGDLKQTNSISIIELDSRSFFSVALNESLNVLLLYHSPYCSFCLGPSNWFLHLALLLKKIPDLKLARIDGESNDLPWQYTVHAYPSVIFYPARRKSESRMFPRTFPIVLTTLSRFLLANLKEYERVSVMLALCARWGPKPLATNEGDLCLRGVRAHTLKSILVTLRRYRVGLLSLQHSNDPELTPQIHLRLRYLMKILQYLKTAHILLAHVRDIDATVVHLEKLKSQIQLN